MSIHSRLLVPCVLVAACGGKSVSEVDDAELTANAQAAGEQSADIGELPEDASEDDVSSAVITLGTSFQAIQGRHQANYAAGKRSSGPVSPDSLLAKAAEGEVLWDGTTLSMNYSADDSSTGAVTYVVDLTYTRSGDGFVISGSYDLGLDASALGSGIVYDLSVTYEDLTTDGTGCPVGGALDLSYDYDVQVAGVAVPGVGAATGTSLSGRVRVEYNGCDDVTVFASNG